MNNLLDIKNIPDNPDETEDRANMKDAEVLYWAFGSNWQDMTEDDIHDLAENEDEFTQWVKDYLAPDVDMAETILACMVVKNDPSNGNYTIALWKEGNVNVESNDGEKRSTEHAIEIVLTEEVSEFLKHSLEIIENAIQLATVIIDNYSELVQNAGIDLKVLGELTADPDGLMDKLSRAVADPKEYLK